MKHDNNNDFIYRIIFTVFTTYLIALPSINCKRNNEIFLKRKKVLCQTYIDKNEIRENSNAIDVIRVSIILMSIELSLEKKQLIANEIDIKIGRNRSTSASTEEELFPSSTLPSPHNNNVNINNNENMDSMNESMNRNSSINVSRKTYNRKGNFEKEIILVPLRVPNVDIYLKTGSVCLFCTFNFSYYRRLEEIENNYLKLLNNNSIDSSCSFISNPAVYSNSHLSRMEVESSPLSTTSSILSTTTTTTTSCFLQILRILTVVQNFCSQSRYPERNLENNLSRNLLGSCVNENVIHHFLITNSSINDIRQQFLDETSLRIDNKNFEELSKNDSLRKCMIEWHRSLVLPFISINSSRHRRIVNTLYRLNDKGYEVQQQQQQEQELYDKRTMLNSSQSNWQLIMNRNKRTDGICFNLTNISIYTYFKDSTKKNFLQNHFHLNCSENRRILSDNSSSYCRSFVLSWKNISQFENESKKNDFSISGVRSSQQNLTLTRKDSVNSSTELPNDQLKSMQNIFSFIPNRNNQEKQKNSFLRPPQSTIMNSAEYSDIDWHIHPKFQVVYLMLEHLLTSTRHVIDDINTAFVLPSTNSNEKLNENDLPLSEKIDKEEKQKFLDFYEYRSSWDIQSSSLNNNQLYVETTNLKNNDDENKCRIVYT
ncbi:hypothetical protein SNEBB_002678 [Seison nebaliae]|nr:hypothetical protein SNEBB_002678 [Seison nebaliae]